MSNYYEELTKSLSKTHNIGVTAGKVMGAQAIEQAFLEADCKTVEEAYQIIAKARAKLNDEQIASVQSTIDDGMTAEQYDAEAKADNRTSEQFLNV